MSQMTVYTYTVFVVTILLFQLVTVKFTHIYLCGLFADLEHGLWPAEIVQMLSDCIQF